jgi:hypothetical protein
MKLMPLQMVIIDLENGRRGVFIGRPLVSEDENEHDCEVENVWFTNIQELPDSSTLEQLGQLVNAHLTQVKVTLQ